MERRQEQSAPHERAHEFIRALVPNWIPTRNQALWAVRVTIASVIVVSILELIGDYYNKTLWDWAELLIVPTVLAAGGVWFNRQQQERALRMEEERTQDEALRVYLDQVSQMLSDKKQPLDKAESRDSLSIVGRALTLTVLPRLNGDRKRSVVQFLYESNLINREQSIFKLGGARTPKIGDTPIPFSLAFSGANLRKANLDFLNLSGADLSGVDLGEATLLAADLTDAKLSGSMLMSTQLIGTTLTNADLSDSFLPGAFLIGADLRGAILSNATLTGANLTEAKVTKEQLDTCNSLMGVTMPDGSRPQPLPSREEDIVARYHQTLIQKYRQEERRIRS